MDNVRELIRIAHRKIDGGAGRLETAAELIALVKSYRGERNAERDTEWLQSRIAKSEEVAARERDNDHRAAYPGGRRAASYATVTAKAGESD